MRKAVWWWSPPRAAPISCGVPRGTLSRRTSRAAAPGARRLGHAYAPLVRRGAEESAMEESNKESAARTPFRLEEERFRRPAPRQDPRGRRRARPLLAEVEADPSLAGALDLAGPGGADRHPGRVRLVSEPWPGCFVYEVLDAPGLTVMTGALGLGEQMRWAHRCLADFSREPHTNLTVLEGPQPDLWAAALAGGGLPFSKMLRLRWASLGYWYDWSRRSYDPALRAPFPDDLADLARRLAAAASPDDPPLVPEAALVNYYPLKGVMGPHVDDAEKARSPPIVSLSLGCMGVFLLGGTDLQTRPVAVRLRSGDVVVMGGPSRLCYHAVPRIVADSFQPDADEARRGALAAGVPESEVSFVLDYMSDHRLNVNVRQYE